MICLCGFVLCNHRKCQQHGFPIKGNIAHYHSKRKKTKNKRCKFDFKLPNYQSMNVLKKCDFGSSFIALCVKEKKNVHKKNFVSYFIAIVHTQTHEWVSLVNEVGRYGFATFC